jgi:signal transduction histidine kinase
MSIGTRLGRGSTHAWEQLWVWWVAMFGFALLVVGAAFAFADGLDPWQRAAGLGGLVVIAAGYAFIGFPAQRAENDRRTAIYLTIAITIEAGLLSLHVAAFTLLFGLFPQCYAGFRRIRYGVIAGFVLTAVVGVASFGWAGWKVRELPSVVVQMSFTVAFGLLFAVWITRIIKQSGERAELITELERTRSELAEVNRAAGVQSERERLAAEIHDTLAQGFTSIVLLASVAQARIPNPPSELATIEATARENLAEARALVAALQPAPLQNASLDGAIGRVVERFSSETGIGATFAVTGSPVALGSDRDIALLRSAQEALSNIRKHTQATAVAVTLTYGEEIHLEVTDNGGGFDPQQATDGFGLVGLRRRLEQLGGRLVVASLQDTREAGNRSGTDGSRAVATHHLGVAVQAIVGRP